MKKGVSHMPFMTRTQNCVPYKSQKLSSHVQDICVFNALKMTLEINKAISFEVLIIPNPILFFFSVNKMPRHTS